MKNRNILTVGLLLVATSWGFNSCTHEPYVMPDTQRTADPGICFERDILPIFVSNCAKSHCHDATSREEGYVLDNYANIMKKGIVPGNAAASKIWESVAIEKNGDGAMPQGAPPLSAHDLDLLRRWITAGAVDSGACTGSGCDSNNYTYTTGIQPLMQKYCTGCHNSPTAPGGSLMDYTSVRNAAVGGTMVGNISHLAGYKVMPPAGITLSVCEVAQVKKWVAAGAQNN